MIACAARLAIGALGRNFGLFFSFSLVPLPLLAAELEDLDPKLPTGGDVIRNVTCSEIVAVAADAVSNIALSNRSVE